MNDPHLVLVSLKIYKCSDVFRCGFMKGLLCVPDEKLELQKHEGKTHLPLCMLKFNLHLTDAPFWKI